MADKKTEEELLSFAGAAAPQVPAFRDLIRQYYEGELDEGSDLYALMRRRLTELGLSVENLDTDPELFGGQTPDAAIEGWVNRAVLEEGRDVSARGVETSEATGAAIFSDTLQTMDPEDSGFLQSAVSDVNVTPDEDFQLFDADVQFLTTNRPVAKLGNRYSQTGVYQNQALQEMAGKSPTQVVQFLRRLEIADPRRFTEFQAILYEAGYYGDSQPTFGVYEWDSRQAISELLNDLTFRLDKPIQQIVAERTTRRQQEIQSGIERSRQEGLDAINAAGQNITTSVMKQGSAEQYVDEFSKELMGRKLSDDARVAWANRLRDKQRAAEQQRIQPQIEQYQTLVDQWEAATNGEDGDQIDTFLNSVVEVDGTLWGEGEHNAQGPFLDRTKLPNNWVQWARNAGVDPADTSTTAQEKVARHQVTRLYDQLGDWSQVAIMWKSQNGGFDIPEHERNPADRGFGLNRRTLPGDYAQAITERMEMNSIATSTSEGDPSAPGPLKIHEVEQFDPAMETESFLRRQFNDEVTAKEYARQANAFTDMLGGI